ncbi:hypothetical protein [Chryseobacterium sp. M5A1_1a]
MKKIVIVTFLVIIECIQAIRVNIRNLELNDNPQKVTETERKITNNSFCFSKKYAIENLYFYGFSGNQLFNVIDIFRNRKTDSSSSPIKLNLEFCFALA